MACAPAQVPGLSLQLRARAAHAPLSESVESALGQLGMACIASGAVGDVHKSYFAAQLQPTPGRTGAGGVHSGAELVMLELVIAPAIGGGGGVAAVATFRCVTQAVLWPLASHFGAILTHVLGSEPFV